MNMWTVTCLKKFKGKIERLSKNDLRILKRLGFLLSAYDGFLFNGSFYGQL
jgi:mRNA-degrading endonuclease RelE of RelBE toxin-antitoxin system